MDARLAHSQRQGCLPATVVPRSTSSTETRQRGKKTVSTGAARCPAAAGQPPGSKAASAHSSSLLAAGREATRMEGK